MGTRFSFDDPNQIYEEEYARIYRAVERDLFTYRWNIIEAFEQEWHNADARALAYIASEADQPEKILASVADGLFGIAFRDMLTLAIGHVADHLTVQHVRGYWPQWSKA